MDDSELVMSNALTYIRNDRWDDVKTLLARNELDTLSGDEKSTLLSELAYHREPQFVYWLTNSGADPNFYFTGNQQTYFSYDLEIGTTPIGQTILGSTYKKNPTLPIMQALLMVGADPNQITYSGYTPLQLAIVNDRPEFAATLLLNGADPKKPSADPDKPDAFVFASDIKWAMLMLRRWGASSDYSWKPPRIEGC